MKLSKWRALLVVAFLFSGYAQAKGDIFYTVPFSNVEIQAASKIYVSYQLTSAQQPTVVCKTSSTDAITSAEWMYKGATRKIGLPITLKDDARSPGYYADPQGKLTITNEYGPSLFVSCEYQKVS